MTAEVPLSVIMPVWNAKRYIRKAIDSILNQTFSNFEFIIVDDGSTDRTLDLLQQYEKKDSRICIISRPNTGIVGALNDGIKAAQGIFIARMDSDDIALPERLNLQVAYLEKNPNCVILGTSIYFMDAAGNIVKKGDRPTEHKEIENELLKGNGGAIIHPTAIMRREAVLKVGRYRQEAKYLEDLDLYLRLAQIGELANLDETLLCYRVHYQSINYKKFLIQSERYGIILKEAYESRDLPFDNTIVESCLNSRQSPADDHRDWAVTSLEFGSSKVPLKHALAACLWEPLNRKSWKCLSYVIKRLLKII